MRDAGVPASKISTMGKGESEPVCDNCRRSGGAMYRRVEDIALCGRA